MSDAKTQVKVRIYTEEDVAMHKRQKDVWVIQNGKIYDITDFIEDHPGGPEMIMPYAGKDLDGCMEDPKEHSHSESAYELLEEYAIGRIGEKTQIVSEDVEITEDFHPEDTDIMMDYQKAQFLDLNKPLLRQVWESNFSKNFYLQQVHQPRHVPYSARLFGNDFLEMFTKTSWYVVPMLWLPIAAYFFNRAWTNTGGDLVYCGLSFLLGNFVWTILEYTLHRFLFHIDDVLPDHPVFITLHFLMHGIHHYLPMDKLRLVMPPLLFFVLQYPFTKLFWAILPQNLADAAIAGGFTFYVLYDVMHYSLHHNRFFWDHLKTMKKYHMAHHYKNYESGFGVTSKIWDYVFGTQLNL